MTAAGRQRVFGKRLGYAALALFLAGFLVAEMVWVPSSGHNRAQIWAPLLFGILPDLPLLAGGGPGLERGQIQRRAVPYYNLTHRLWLGPLLLVAAGLVLPGSPWLLAGLGWALHIAADRALGFGLRDKAGFARPI